MHKFGGIDGIWQDKVGIRLTEKPVAWFVSQGVDAYDSTAATFPMVDEVVVEPGSFGAYGDAVDGPEPPEVLRVVRPTNDSQSARFA